MEREMNIRKIRKNFAVMLSGLVLALLLIGTFFMISVMRSVSYQQLQAAGKGRAAQAAASFEFAIFQIGEQVDKLAAYDNDIARLARDRYENSVSARELYSRLRSIKMGSPYIAAVYLYSQSEDRFLDADKGCSYLSEDFADPLLRGAATSRFITSVPPHLVRLDRGADEVLCFTMIVPLLQNANKTEFSLCIQVDLDKLFGEVIREEEKNEGTRLFLYGEEETILAASDHSTIGEQIETVKKKSPDRSAISLLLGRGGMMDAQIWSGSLGWYFYLQMPYRIEMPGTFTLYVIIVTAILILIVILILVYFLSCRIMRPLRKAAKDLNEKLLREILTDSYMEQKGGEEYQTLKNRFQYPYFRCVTADSLHNLPEFSRAALNVIGKAAEGEEIGIWAVSMSGSRIAVILNYDQKLWGEEKESACLKKMLAEFDRTYRDEAYFAVSLPKAGLDQLALAYRECDEIENYKLYMKKRILRYEELQDRKISFFYPAELERQLINNLLIGNQEGCILYMEKFTEYLLENEGTFSDSQIIGAVYQLQNEILKRISSLPISVNTSSLANIREQAGREQLKGALEVFIRSLSSEIVKKNQKNESLLNESIMEYIDEHLMDEDFNLNAISYQFNLNRNYLAKMIKEMTGKPFNEYVNSKKITSAKQLLVESKFSVEEIAHRAGFSYAHYFIKIFKTQEGVTPGQYREMHLNNNFAPD